jgi:hypothetical protein
MLTMSIPSLEFVKNENIDIYLQPLVEELKKLWIGVPIVDVTMLVRSQSFSLRAICMWNIHDYLAYGLFTRCQVKGYMATPLCGPNLETKRSFQLKKNLYQGHWRYLGRHHPYRRNHAALNGKLEPRLAPIQMSIVDFLARVEECEEWLNMKSMWAIKDKDDLVHVHGVKIKNIFFYLLYWQVEIDHTCFKLYSLYHLCEAWGIKTSLPICLKYDT